MSRNESFVPVNVTVDLFTEYLELEGEMLYVGRYATDGTLALGFMNEFDEIEVLSVNLGGYGLTPEPNHVFVKDYSEHEGLTDALVASRAVKVVEPVQIGFGRGFKVELLFDGESLAPVVPA